MHLVGPILYMYIYHAYMFLRFVKVPHSYFFQWLWKQRLLKIQQKNTISFAFSYQQFSFYNWCGPFKATWSTPKIAGHFSDALIDNHWGFGTLYDICSSHSACTMASTIEKVEREQTWQRVFGIQQECSKDLPNPCTRIQTLILFVHFLSNTLRCSMVFTRFL